MYSQKRRMERYRIIYIWKIVGIKSYTRQGYMCQVLQIKQCGSGKIRAIRKGAFKLGIHRFSTAVSVNMRGQTGCSVTSFNHKLDTYLQNIPGKPKYQTAQSKPTQSPSHL